jgi:hypothetical protein
VLSRIPVTTALASVVSQAPGRFREAKRHFVAPRQSTQKLDLASDNHTEHHEFVAVINSHPDCRALSSCLSRYSRQEATVIDLEKRKLNAQ